MRPRRNKGLFIFFSLVIVLFVGSAWSMWKSRPADDSIGISITVTQDVGETGERVVEKTIGPIQVAQGQNCCTHLGQQVQCPQGLPPGSGSVQFVEGGTQWRTPAGSTVFVPSTTFSPCPATPPTSTQPPPTLTQPPPATRPGETREPSGTDRGREARPPETDQPPEERRVREPRAPAPRPEDLGRGAQDRARGLIEGDLSQPIIPGPTEQSADRETDGMIQRMGTQIRQQEQPTPRTQTRTPTPGTTTRQPGDDPRDVPVDIPIPTPPPPTTFGELLEQDFCCGKKGNLITYPITTDPEAVVPDPPAARDIAVVGVQVLPHNGAYFQNERDLKVAAVAFPIDWMRFWVGKVDFQDGGLMGGWDFSYNKRIVPLASRKLGNGLFLEQAGIEKARLHYFNGQVRGELYIELPPSEERTVVNFDSAFRAYVTTYQSPPGQFHEIERYILVDEKTLHPFREHPNVEKTERIFYVLREKNGTRYVFNCRGQLIYILSTHDSPKQRVRVELRYGGRLNPLTQNPLLTEIIDTVNRKYTVRSISIHQGSVSTNINCKLVSGTYPIDRIKEVTGAGIRVEYLYRAKDTEPVLEGVRITQGNVVREWRYGYDQKLQLKTVMGPNEAAKGTTGKPYIINDYDGEGRVVAQQVGGMRHTIAYVSDGVTLADADDNKREVKLEKVGGYPVIKSVTIRPKSNQFGGPWTTSYEHNSDTQVTRVTFPRKNSIVYEYDSANAPVTLGPIRDWVEKRWTYESDLSKGNLLRTTLVAPDGKTITSTQTYEALYNKTLTQTDALGNTTTYTYEYDSPANRGNPMSISDPPVQRPDGSTLKRPVVKFTYNDRGQNIRAEVGGPDRATTYTFDDKTGYLNRIDYPDGTYAAFTVNNRGVVTEESGSAGKKKYELDGRDLIRAEILDPDDLAVTTRYNYDLNGNLIQVLKRIEDHFRGGQGAALGLIPNTLNDVLTTYTYDILNRITGESTTGLADKASRWREYKFRPTGEIESVMLPSYTGSGNHVTRFKTDVRGFVVEEREIDGKNDILVSKYVRDDNGNLVHVTRGSGDAKSETTATYDGFDRVHAMTNGSGAKYNFSYDAKNNITRAVVEGPAKPGGPSRVLFRGEYDFDGYGHLIEKRIDTLTDGVQKTRWFYNENLLLEKTVGPNQGEMRFEYDKLGRVTQVTDPVGNRTVNNYDKAGNLVKSIQVAKEQRFDNASGRYDTVEASYEANLIHDSLGRLIRMSANGDEQQIFYNSLGASRAVYSRQSGLSTFAYDGLGRRVRFQHGEEFESRKLNAAGLPLEVQTRLTHNAYTYDNLGRVVMRTDRRSGARWLTKYDDLNRVTESADPNGTTEKRRYEHNGLRTRITVTFGIDIVIRVSGRQIPAVQGVEWEIIDHDALGRIVGTQTSEESVVNITYDGLSRPIREVQAFRGVGQTIERIYAADETSYELRYPELAGKVLLRKWFDPMGRVENVDLDGETIASYLYSGADQIALKGFGNQIESRFSYDKLRRLDGIAVAASGGGSAGSVLWSTRAQYGADGPAEIQETVQPAPDVPATVSVTRFTRDAQGRVIASRTTTGNLAGPDRPQTSMTSGILSQFQNGRIARMAEFLKDEISGTLLSARVDGFNYDSAGRVESVKTTGRNDFSDEIGFTDSIGALLTATNPDAPGSKVDTTSIAELTKAAEGGRAITDTQKFHYDRNGNLLADGRFVYVYDYKNRLIRVEDTEAPYRYLEKIFFYYDSFDRRIYSSPYRDRVPIGFLEWAPEWTKENQWFLYDGRTAIAEIWCGHPKADKAYVLLARYFTGARQGERIRMDRRPENDPKAPLTILYLHEDLQGNTKLVTFADLTVALTHNTQPRPGEAPASAGAPPEDRVMAGDTAVRVPYMSGSTRIDGFAGTVYREDLGQAIYDNRSAHGYGKKVDQAVFRENITAYQNRMLAVLGIAAAVPFVGPYAIIFAKEAAVGAIIGGTLNVGMNLYAAHRTQNEYTWTEAASNFARGGISGAAGGIVGAFGFGLARELVIDYVVNVSTDTLIDVGVNGANAGEALTANLVASAQGSLMGFGIGRVTSGIRGLGEAATARLSNRGAVMQSSRGAGKPSTGLRGIYSRWVDYLMSQPARAMDLELSVLPKMAEHRALEATIEHELLNGTTLEKEIGRRLQTGQLELRFSRFAEPLGGITYGEMYADDMFRQIIHINVDRIPRNPRTGAFYSQQVTSTVVHEAVHSLGYGEVHAHIAQAQFLGRRLKDKLRNSPRGAYLDLADTPYLDSHHVELVNAYLRGGPDGVYDFILHAANYHPTKVELPLSYQPDPWVEMQGGMTRLLGINPIFIQDIGFSQSMLGAGTGRL